MLSTGFKSCEFGDHSWGGINSGVSLSNNAIVARARWAFQVLQGSLETLFRCGGKRLHHAEANLFRKLCAKFHENCPKCCRRYYRKHFGLFFSGHSVYCLAQASSQSQLLQLKALHKTHITPVDLNASPVIVAAANVLSSSSAPRTLQTITPQTLYISATQTQTRLNNPHYAIHLQRHSCSAKPTLCLTNTKKYFTCMHRKECTFNCIAQLVFPF